MKATEIKLTIQKDCLDGDKAWIGIAYALDEADDVMQSFVTARKQLEKAFETAYGIKKDDRKSLELNSKEFDRVCKALKDGKTDLKDLEKYFVVSQEAVNYFKTNSLI